MTGIVQVALVATVILALTFLAARGLREGWDAVEQYRADVAQADAVDAWDADVTDALRLAAIGPAGVTMTRRDWGELAWWTTLVVGPWIVLVLAVSR